MKRFLVVVLAFILIISFLSGCSGSEITSNVSDDNSRKIGLVISTLNNPFFINLKVGAEAKAKEMDYELIILDSQNDLKKELTNMEALIEMGVAIILLNPCDSSLSANVVKLANTSEIPVITLDRTIDEGEVVCHITSDNVAGGVMAADYINDKLSGNGKIVELEGIKGTSAAIERSKGFTERLDIYPNLNVIYSKSAGFDRAMGLSVMEEILKSSSDIQAVFAHNDEMALGAIQAIATSGKSILVVGFDGITDAIIAVNEGEMDATIAQQPDQIGKLGIVVADQYLSGEQVEKIVLVELMLIEKK